MPIESTSTCESAPEAIVATVPPATGVRGGEEASAIVAKSSSTHEAVALRRSLASVTSRAISRSLACRERHDDEPIVSAPQSPHLNSRLPDLLAVS